MLTDKDDDGEYRIPLHHRLRCVFASETVAFADLVLPDTTYLERHDAISLLDRPISDADGPADAIRHPVRRARPRRAAVPGRADRARRAPAAARHSTSADGARKYRDYADYIVRHERAPGHRPARRLARRGRRRARQGRAEPESVRALHRERLLLAPRPCRTTQRYYKMEPRLSRMRAAPSASSPTPSRSSSSSTPSRCRTSASPRRAMARSQPPRAHARARRAPISIRCRSGTRRFERGVSRPGDVSAARDHAAADGACTTRGARRTPGCARSPAQNFLYMHPRPRARAGLADGDWIWIEAATAASRCADARYATASSPDTVWTWNAIGKRTRRMESRRRCARSRSTGFLLNHLIMRASAGDATAHARERRPGHRPGRLVRPARAHRQGRRRRRGREPQFDALRTPPRHRAGARQRVVRYGAQFRRRGRAMTNADDHRAAATDEEARARDRPRHLRRLPRLRGRVQGMERRRRSRRR